MEQPDHRQQRLPRDRAPESRGIHRDQQPGAGREGVLCHGVGPSSPTRSSKLSVLIACAFSATRPDMANRRRQGNSDTVRQQRRFDQHSVHCLRLHLSVRTSHVSFLSYFAQTVSHSVFSVFAISVDLGQISSITSPVVWAVGYVRDPVVQYTTSTGSTEIRRPYYATQYSSIGSAVRIGAHFAPLHCARLFADPRACVRRIDRRVHGRFLGGARPCGCARPEDHECRRPDLDQLCRPSLAQCAASDGCARHHSFERFERKHRPDGR